MNVAPFEGIANVQLATALLAMEIRETSRVPGDTPSCLSIEEALDAAIEHPKFRFKRAWELMSPWDREVQRMFLRSLLTVCWDEVDDLIERSHIRTCYPSPLKDTGENSASDVEEN